MKPTRTERPRLRQLARSCIALALVAGALAGSGSGTLLAQDATGCETTDLGTLGGTPDSTLSATGRWTTEDCDSRFRAGSDAHTFKFRIAAPARIRVSLTSAEADSYLYLLAEDGSRITDNDDRGAGLDARVERDLAPGAYLVEATTVGGRDRGPAGFTLTVSRPAGCELVHLGTLGPGDDLTATGSWSLDTCGSRFVSSHPAHGFAFSLAEAARVRIDLESESGDPVLSLASPDGIIGANDDGGERRNARIEQYLHPGLYFIEATTYYARDYQPLQADFTLTVRVVDETARQQSPKLKIEDVHTPAEVVAGDPFPVHYRVGNVGGGALPDDGSHALIYVVGIGVQDWISSVSGVWDAGVAYHTGAETASAVSTRIDEVAPLEATFKEHGPSWIFVGAVTYDRYGNETGFHGLWHNLTVLSHPQIDPVRVEVDGTAYRVSADADADGLVTTTVKADASPAAGIDPDVRAKAIYAAGVYTLLLDGVFERPAIAGLSRGASPVPVSVADPSSAALLKAVGQRFASTDGFAGMQRALAYREAINPLAVEESVLAASRSALSQYASIADSWDSLLRRLDAGDLLSFEEAHAVQSQLGYAERVVSPAATAAEIVAAARASDRGWEDPEVKAMMADHATCRPGPAALRRALEAADAAEIDRLLALDAEMRAVRPIHGLAVDGALCAAAAADPDNSRFLQRYAIGYSTDLRDLIAPPAGEPAPIAHRLRIIARLADDGRIEHGVELSSGRRILPPARFLEADSPAGAWQISGTVEVRGDPIGRIRFRRVDDGRVEMGFVGDDGLGIAPDIAFVPADPPPGVWFRSSEINVRAAAMTTSES